MAARFWVGSGTWDSVNTANWSATSGGATGASVPTSADDVTFDVNSGNCTVSGTVNCLSLTVGTGFVNGLSSGSSFDTLGISGTTGTVLTLTPGAAAALNPIYIAIPITSGSVSINVNVSSIFGISGILNLGAVGSTATFTLSTNANYYNTTLSSGLAIDFLGGTLSTGTTAPVFNSLNMINGTFNGNASAVTFYNAFFLVPQDSSSSITATLGTSTITGVGSNFTQLVIGSISFVGTTTITTGATQTLNAKLINLFPTVTATLRTIATPTGEGQIYITLPSGVNLTAGAVTCNGIFRANATASYTTLPVLTLTSITGTNTSTNFECSVVIEDIGFTCGAISLTYNSSSFGTLLYQETSRGTVNVTGAITLTDTLLTASPTININSQSAFSGTPTITYTGLNASVRGTVAVRSARNIVGLGAITTSIFSDLSAGGNIVAGAITLGGTLSAVVYNGVFEALPTANHNFTSGNIGPGTGALVDFRVEQDSLPGTFTSGTITAHTRFRLRNYGGTVNIGAVSVIANTSFADNFSITGSTITTTSLSFSGSVLTTANFIEIGTVSSPVTSSLTISSSVTTGSSASNRLALIITANGAGISFTNPSVVHSVSQLIAYDYGAITFVGTHTLNLNENVAGTYPTGIQDPLYLLTSVALGATTLPGTLTSTYTSIAKKFYIYAPGSAVTFQGTYTLGSNAATRGFVDITCASYSGNTALSTSGFIVTASGAVSQTGIVTISTTSVTNPAFAIYINAGTTSTFQGIDASAITDTSQQYDFSFVGGASGTLTIASTIAGPTATNVFSRLYIARTAATTFSAAAIITNIRSLEHYAGNVTFTGLGNTTVRRYVLFTAGYTIVFPAAHTLTINGTATTPNDAGVAELNHGGYTYNAIVFSATASQQYIDNTTSASGLTAAGFTSNGAAVPYSFLVLKTNVNTTSSCTISPNSITNRHLVCSDRIGTPRTLTAATRTINAGTDFQDITAAGATPWNLSAVSVGDAGGNSNITFSTPVTRTLAVTTGSVNWDATATWSGATVPLAHDIADISAGTASLTINTNNRAYLGNITFGTFAGTIVVSQVLTAQTIATVNTINSINLSSVTGSYTTGPLVFISRGAVTFSPPASSAVFGPGLTIINTGSLTMAGANDLVLGAACPLGISSASFNTNTGTRICNISTVTGANIGGAAGSFTSSYNAATASNLNSSTVACGGFLTLRNCSGTTATITATGGMAIEDSINFTNATITPSTDINFFLGVSASNNITLGSSVISAINVYFNAGFTFNSASATINVTQGVFQTSSSPATWVEGTTQVNFTGAMPNAFLTFSFLGDLTSSTVHRVTINDTASTLGATTEIFLGGNGTNPAIRFFDASAMRRPLRLGSQQLYGGLNAVFSNRAYTYLRTPSQYRIVGSDPLYIPYAFCNGANVVSGSIVAYGPADLGGNVGNITFPSRLRYYAFVDTATSMTVPNDYNGMGLLLAVGGGATPSSVATVGSSKGGGGGGGISYTFLLSPNNLTAPVVPGQTIFIRAGAYAVAPVANTAGGNGNTSWANVSSNIAPTTTIQGVLANGGGTTTSSSSGNGGSLTGAIGTITIAGGSGSAGNIINGGGGGGGSARFSSLITSGNNIASGGAGTISSSLSTGQGGSGSVAGGAAGTAGLTPTAGANGSSSTGAGGGGGGGNTYNPGTTITTDVTRASGSTTMVFNVTNHGFVAGDRLVITITVAQKTGTWSKSSTLVTASVTVNITNHGLIAGQQFYFARNTGSVVPSGTYTVSTATTNSFTFVPSVTGASSGNCTLGQAGLTSSSNYAVTINTPNQFQVTGTVSTLLLSGQFSYTYRPVYIRPEYRGANGGSGALNSSENFIRYYNNVYTPGYFGIGGAGGGGGIVAFRATNLGNSGGNGGDGGIGSGGGGIGLAGDLVPGTITSVATSGRGGPGLVMFIYALRANNQSTIQGQ